MLTHAKPVIPSTEPFSAASLAEQIAVLAQEHGSNERELRIAIAQKLESQRWRIGRKAAEQQLLKDRRGRQCAERLCRMQDEIIRVLFEFRLPEALRRRTIRRIPNAWRSSPPAAMAAA